MPVPAQLAGRLHKLLDLFAGQIFPGSATEEFTVFGVEAPSIK
jgi:hypothetical protein